MNNFIENYPSYFSSLEPSAIRLYGKLVKKDVWQKVYLHIGQELFFVSVTPLIDDREFDYVFCLELIRVEEKAMGRFHVEELVKQHNAVIEPEYVAMSERFSGEGCRSIKRLSIYDDQRRTVIAPSYDKYFSCHIQFSEKKTGGGLENKSV